jgi:hypothetical protein
MGYMMPSQARSSSFIIRITPVQSVSILEHFDYSCNFFPYDFKTEFYVTVIVE